MAENYPLKELCPQVIMVVNEGVFVRGKVNVGNAVQHLKLLYKNLGLDKSFSK